MANSNDVIRQQMLQYFYDRNQYSTSEKGKKGSHVKISDVKSELKEKHGLTQTQVASQLTYLISSGWVTKVSDERSFTTKGGAQVPRSQEWYVITADGIDRIEGESSAFMRQSPYSSVNITAVNSAVQLGDGNIVNESFVGLAEELAHLGKEISDSDLSDEEKMSAIAEIETINGQLAKPNPSKEIIKIACDSLTTGKAAAVVQSVASLAKAVQTSGIF